MTHPWLQSRPISGWLPGEYSRVNTKVSRNRRPLLDHRLCNRCSLCWIFCPEGIISRGDRYEIDYTYCKGCGICAEECPREAIAMVREG